MRVNEHPLIKWPWDAYLSFLAIILLFAVSCFNGDLSKPHLKQHSVFDVLFLVAMVIFIRLISNNSQIPSKEILKNAV